MSNKDCDLIFKCRKCYHLVYLANSLLKKVRNLSVMNCPECGEEGEENWIYVGTGNYDLEYG